MALLQYLSVIICMYATITMAKGNIMNRDGDLETSCNGKVSLPDRRKRMANNNNFVSRCWDDVNRTIVNSTLQRNCLYITQRVYIGCFEDKYNRALPSNPIYSSDYMTIDWCIAHCYHRGHMFAGLQNAEQCFCGGNTYFKYGRKPDSDCNKNCEGNLRERCGSNWRNSVYNTTSADEVLCYKLMQSSGTITLDAEECTRYNADYGLADVSSALILDGFAELARLDDSISDRYWLRVRSPLHNIPPTRDSCSTYEADFAINDNECTYLQLKSDKYVVRKHKCQNATTNDGFICHGRFEVTPDTPTTTLVNIGLFTYDEITTIEFSSGITTTRHSERDVSKMSNVVTPITASVVAAVVCIVVLAILLIKRRTSKNGEPRSIPPNVEIHGVPTTEENQQNHGNNSSNHVHLSDTAQKNHNSNFVVVENDVYNDQYDIPMLPIESSKSETLINDPQYDVVPLEEEGNINLEYDELNRVNEGSLHSLNRRKERIVNPQYDVLNLEKKGEQSQVVVVYPEDVEDEMPEDEYVYGDFIQ